MSDDSNLQFIEYATGTVWLRKSNGQKMLTVDSNSDIEPGEDVVVIRESVFEKIREDVDI